jgi:hypothetical protein
MDYTPKPGCPMCGIVAAARAGTLGRAAPGAQAPRAAQAPDVLWRDDNFTVYRERAHPVSSKAHVIVAFKCVRGLAGRRARRR